MIVIAETTCFTFILLYLQGFRYGSGVLHTTTDKRGYLHRIGCVCKSNTNSIVELHLFGYGDIVWQSDGKHKYDTDDD